VEVDEASEMGLVERRAPKGGACEAALRLAQEVACMAPLATAATKEALGRCVDALEEVLAAEADIQARLTYSVDYVEGRAAFREKRAPRFTGA